MPSGLHPVIHRRQAAWWTFAAGLAATAVLGWTLHHEAVALDRQRLALRAAEIQTLLDARLEQSEMLLQHLRDYLMLSGESRNAVFARWCYENGLTINCPWILGIAVATNRHEVNLRTLLPKPPANWTNEDLAVLGQLVAETSIECGLALRSDITNVLQFLPDYDLRCTFADRDQPQKPRTSKTWLVSAILGSRLSMSMRQPLMRDTNSNAIVGTVFYVPVYRPGLGEYLTTPVLLPHDHRYVRWLHLSAVIVAPVDFKRLVGLLELESADLGLEVFSSTNQTAETWLNRDRATPRADDPGFRAYLTHRQTWRMYGMNFSIFFHTTPLFEAQSPRHLAKIAVAAGSGLTLLTTALVGLALRARNQQAALTEQIREARDALAAAEQERHRISRDLHDGTIQSLYAIQLGLERTLEQVQAEPQRAGRELWLVRRELDTVIAEIRQFVSAEAEAGVVVDFAAVLQSLAQRANGGGKSVVRLRCDPGAADRLGAAQAVHLANITREALSNSIRHGRPRCVQLSLRLDQDSVVLEIADDGTGFDPKAPVRKGVGLSSMASRARELRGTFEIRSAPGQGTTVTIRMPGQSFEDSPAD